MDYKGQRLSEYIYSFLVIFFGAVAWIAGWVQGDFLITFYGWAAGLALALLVNKMYSFHIHVHSFLCIFQLLALPSLSCAFRTGPCTTATLLPGWRRLERVTSRSHLLPRSPIRPRKRRRRKLLRQRAANSTGSISRDSSGFFSWTAHDAYCRLP